MVKQVPEQFAFIKRDAFYRSIRTNVLDIQAAPKKDHDDYQILANTVIDEVAKIYPITVVDPAEVLCGQGEACALERDGVFLYRDENHLNKAGAMLLESLFAPIFNPSPIK